MLTEFPLKDGPDSVFYAKSLDAFNAAHTVDQFDPLILHNLGFILLHSKRHLNVDQAEKYFKDSAENAAAFNLELKDARLKRLASSSLH